MTRAEQDQGVAAWVEAVAPMEWLMETDQRFCGYRLEVEALRQGVSLLPTVQLYDRKGHPYCRWLFIQIRKTVAPILEALSREPALPRLVELYITLAVCTGLGWLVEPYLQPKLLDRVGQGLFWLGMPLSVLGFVLNVRLTGQVWWAGLVALLAFAAAWGLGELWWRWRGRHWPLARRGSLLLTAMAGNTGYVGYPVCLFLVGAEYFAWAVVFDLMNTLAGSYGLGVWLAAKLGGRRAQPWLALVRNPMLWAALLALVLYRLPRPAWVNVSLKTVAWSMVVVCLVLMGVRLRQVRHWGELKPVVASLTIKMLLVPLLVGLLLQGAPTPVRLTLVLQAGMPPAIATLVLTEAYGLDPGFTVSAIGLGLAVLLLTLPVWLLLFGGGMN